MTTTETREQYLLKALQYCNNRLVHHNKLDPYCHVSHNVARAMKDTEECYIDLGTFGVEGDCESNGEGRIDIQYLNTGDSYENTIVYYCDQLIIANWDQLIIANWGDIVEEQL